MKFVFILIACHLRKFFIKKSFNDSCNDRRKCTRRAFLLSISPKKIKSKWKLNLLYKCFTCDTDRSFNCCEILDEASFDSLSIIKINILVINEAMRSLKYNYKAKLVLTTSLCTICSAIHTKLLKLTKCFKPPPNDMLI